MAEHTKSITRLLQHSILQLCNEHVGYSHKLQILGVLCMTVDDEQQELVVKVNNTLKRVNPPMMPGKDGPPVLQPAVAPIAPYSGTLSLEPQGVGMYAPQAHLEDARTASPTQSLPQSHAHTNNSPTNQNNGSTPSRKSHGRKGTNPVKVQHVYDEGELISSEEDQDIMTVIPVDPESSYDMISAPTTSEGMQTSSQASPQRSRTQGSGKRKSRYQSPDNSRESSSQGAISAVRALLMGRGIHSNKEDAPQDLTITRESRTPSPPHRGLTLPVLLPEGDDNRSKSSPQNIDTTDPSTDTNNLDEEATDTNTHNDTRITSPSAYDSPLTIKEEPSDDFSYTGYTNHNGINNNNDMNTNNNNNNNNNCAVSPFDEDLSQQLANFAQTNGVNSSPAISQLLARTSDGLPTQVPYTLAFNSSTPSKQPDGLSIQYTSTGPITVGENGKNVSRSAKSAKVKDIILYDDSSPLHEQRGNRIETDYMLDSFGFEGRKRRRRNQDETLTAEEIAEYLGSMDLGANHVFACKYCTEEIRDLTQYLQHTLTMHHCYICHQCGKSFTTKSSLLRHRPIHTGMRRFACSICKKTFYRKDKCKAHIKRHLGECGEKPEVEHCDQIDGLE